MAVTTSTLATTTAVSTNDSVSSILSSTSSSGSSLTSSLLSTETSIFSPSDTVSASTSSSLVSQVSSSIQRSSTSQHDTISTSVTTSSATTGIASSTATPKSSSNHGLQAGDKIAIALACVVCVFGVWLGCYCAVKRQRRKRRRAAASALVASPQDPATARSLPLTASRDVHANCGPDLDKYLPIPKADRELGSELQSLGHLVQQHVEDHYHGEPKFTTTGFIGQTLVDLGLGEDTKGLPGAAQLANMAANPSIRPLALQHIIMRVVFMSLAMNSKCEISLLPSLVMNMIRDMPPVEEHVGNPAALSSSLTRWRQLSVFLLNAKRSERGVLQPDEDILRVKVKKLVAALNSFLKSFVPKEGRHEQESHLQDVVIECAKFGYVVFSQPAELIWQFKAGKEAEMYIVTCPGLEKVSDNYGVSCEPAVVVAPELHEM